MNITTEDGVTRTIGDRAFNYYDRKPGEIGTIERDGWFDFHQDDGSHAFLDGSRVCSLAFADKRGWLDPNESDY